jgi:hypothetical protein
MGNDHDAPLFVMNEITIWGYPSNHSVCVHHRVGGPAAIRANGDQYWYWHDKLHRVDGPAIIRPASNSEEWYFMDQRHREGGPAIVAADGISLWNDHANQSPVTQGWFCHNAKHRVGAPKNGG